MDEIEIGSSPAEEQLVGVGEAAVLESLDQVSFISFPFDSVDISEGARSILDFAIETLNNFPDSRAEITGYSDSKGEEDYNIELSRRRANAVKRYFVERGVGEERLQVEGRGARLDPAEVIASAVDLEFGVRRIVQIRVNGMSEVIGR